MNKKHISLLAVLAFSIKSTFCSLPPATLTHVDCHPTITINFNLDGRPKDVSVHDWCLEVAARKVQKCETKILKRLFGPNFELTLCQQQPTIKHLEKAYDKFVKTRLRKKKFEEVPKRIYDIVYRLFNRPFVQKHFGKSRIIPCFKELFQYSGQQKTVRYVSHINIFTRKRGLICVRVIDFHRGHAFTIGKNIVIGLNLLNSLASDKEIETCITHELGHLYYQHPFIYFVLKKYHLNTSGRGKKTTTFTSNKYSLRDFITDIRKLRKRHEVQADIFGLLGDLVISKIREIRLRKIFAKKNLDLYLPGLQVPFFTNIPIDPMAILHPTYEQRINYLREINLAMEKERGIVFCDETEAEDLNHTLIKKGETPETIFELGKAELELGEFNKAYKYFSSINDDGQESNLKIKTFENYALGSMTLKKHNFNQAYKLFKICTNQSIENIIKVKSFLQLGYLSKNLDKAKKFLRLAFNQNICLDTKEKAGSASQIKRLLFIPEPATHVNIRETKIVDRGKRVKTKRFILPTALLNM